MNGKYNNFKGLLFRVVACAYFVAIYANVEAQSFSANLLPNQTFSRPTPGTNVCGSPSFGTFTSVSAGSSLFSYATQSFTVSQPGNVVIAVSQTGTTIGDPMLMVYNRFDPLMPTRDFRVGDDDSGPGVMPLIGCENFFLPGTYTLVVTTYQQGAQSGVVNFSISGVDPVMILPTVTTTPADQVTSSSANIGGAVIDDGGADVTERGVAWGTETNPTTGTEMGTGLGSFNDIISELTPGTTYFFRAYATNSVGTAYGPQLSFTTLSAPLNPTDISASDIDICRGGSVELTAIGAEGEVYWYTGGCGEDFIAIGNTLTVSPTETTTYFARNFNNDLYSVGCASIEINIVNQPTPPDISRNPDFNQICEGQVISVNASLGQGGGGVAIDQYSFSNDGGLAWSEWSVNEPSFEAALGINLIRAQRITTASGCNNSEIVSVSWEASEQPSAPELTRIPNNDVVCYNTTLTVETTSGSGGVGDIQDQFRYSTDNGASWSEWSEEVPEFYGAEGVNILQSRRIANGGGCNISEEEVSWVVLPELIPSVVSENQTICHNSIPQPLTATEATGGHNSGYLYQWQWSQDGESWVNLTDETSLVLEPGILETTTHFRLQITENFSPNCAEGVFSNTVTIEAVSEIIPGTISILDDMPASLCHDNNGTIIFGTEDYETTYFWESSTVGPTEGFELLPALVGPWLVVENLVQTTWFRRITILYSNGYSCNSEPSNILEITVQEPVSPGGIEGSQEICYGLTPNSIHNVEAGAGSGLISYIWQSSTISSTDGFFIIDGETSQDYQPEALTQTAWFRRIAVSTFNGVDCRSIPTEAIEITVFNDLQLSASVSNQITCHNESNGEVTLVASGGSGDFEFSIDGLNYFDHNVFDGLSFGNYTVFVRDNEGCEASEEVILVNPEPLTLDVTQTTQIRCRGENNAEVILLGIGGWDGFTYGTDGTSFDSTTVFENLGAGTYNFFVLDAEGCTTSQTIEIEEPEEELSAQILETQDVLCFGLNTGQASVTGLNGWGEYTYTWNTEPNQTTQTATGLAAGHYSVEVQDLNGCTFELDIQITQPDPLLITNAEAENVYCRDEEAGGSIWIVIDGGVEPYSFIWTNNNNTTINNPTSSLDGIPQGIYSVLITDFNGCIIEEDFIVGYDDEDCIVRIPQGFSPNGNGVNDVWEIRNLLYMHPNNRVKIFNRHGTLVFEANNYHDDWDGTPNRNNIVVGSGGKVPQGVYYYLIWLEPNNDPISGYVYISY